MKIKILNFGYKHPPRRAHENDAGADVYVLAPCDIPPHTTVKLPLGFGLELPDGMSAYIYPRSSIASKSLAVHLPPIDSGYKGQIHAIVTNLSDETYHVNEDDRIGQIVILPTIIADFITEDIAQRGDNGFGSTGK